MLTVLRTTCVSYLISIQMILTMSAYRGATCRFYSTSSDVLIGEFEKSRRYRAVQLSDQKHVYGTGDRLRLYLKPAMVKVNHKEVKYTVAIGSFSERASIYTFTAELGPACAARLHEAWRSSRRKAKGDDLPNPRWKKISEDEFEMWRPGVPSEKLAEMYRYAPGLEGDREPDLQWFDENVTQKEKELLVVHNKGHASGRHCGHQPALFLPSRIVEKGK